MPADLDHGADGRASFFAVRQSAWHREGTLLDEAPGLDEALLLANLDYHVVKVPAYRPSGPRADGYLVESEDTYFTVRTDRDVQLGVVGREYEPIQNRDAFEGVRPLLEQGVLSLETGGVLRGGADAWLLARFDLDRCGPIVHEVFGDEVAPFILVANNHAGQRTARIAETTIRVVCANTLDVAIGDLRSGKFRFVAVRHTSGGRWRMADAAEQMLRPIIERFEILAQQYRTLQRTELDEQQFMTLVLDPVAPDPRNDPGWRASNRQAEEALQRALDRRRTIRVLWTEGKGHVGDASAWEAYNGLVQAVDHGHSLFPVRNERTRSLLDGHLFAIKRSCKYRLLAFAATAGASASLR